MAEGTNLLLQLWSLLPWAPHTCRGAALVSKNAVLLGELYSYCQLDPILIALLISKARKVPSISQRLPLGSL